MKKKIILGVLAIILFLAGGYFIYHYYGSTGDKTLKSSSLINISINPNIQLTVNKNNIVEEVVALNNDADILISDLTLVGINGIEAVSKVIDASIETGYIDEYDYENNVVVTTINDNEEVRKKLEDEVVEKINQKLNEREIFGIVIVDGVNDGLKSEAEHYKVSNGKMLLINRAVTVNDKLIKQNLATMSVKEIQQEIKTAVENRREAFKLEKEELKEKFKSEKEALRTEHKNNAKKFKDDLLKEFGEETKDMDEATKEAMVEPLLRYKKDNNMHEAKRYEDMIIDEVKDRTYPEIEQSLGRIKTRMNKIKEIENERNKGRE